MESKEKKPPEVVFTFQEELTPGELEELFAKRDELLREMGYLPPDKEYDFWYKDGTTVGDIGGYFTKPSRVGFSHSYTALETKSASIVNKYVLLAQISGRNLIDYTKEDWYYCIAEDGSVFKYHSEELIFFQLDLEKMQWKRNQNWASLIHDTYLRYQEFDGFRDYFPHAE